MTTTTTSSLAADVLSLATKAPAEISSLASTYLPKADGFVGNIEGAIETAEGLIKTLESLFEGAGVSDVSSLVTGTLATVLKAGTTAAQVAVTEATPNALPPGGSPPA